MARAQANSKKKKPVQASQKKQVEVTKPVVKNLKKPVTRKEPTKNEIMFFRIGMGVVAITLVALAIFFIVQFFNKDEETGPYDDYIHITADDLVQMTFDREDGTYGDFQYFANKPVYEDVFTKLMSNDFVYVYFYRSSAVHEDIKTAIKGIEGFEDMAFFLLDLDLAVNTGIFENVDISHLGLEATKDNQLLVFDMANEDPFSLEINANFIVLDLNALSNEE
ncbi:MAG: hypothetical protein IH571_06545 [Acholeplasmataceae bacterium]|nr:hypothetical protein [Acholeplasmataceae bacterium]